MGGTDCPFDHLPAHHVDRSKLLGDSVPVVLSIGSLQEISNNYSFKVSGTDLEAMPCSSTNRTTFCLPSL